MNNDLPEKGSPDVTASFEQIVLLCEEFTGETITGSCPTLDSYLLRVGEGAQPVLLRNLLALDIKNRRAGGQQPRAEEYIQRFPQFADLVREVFLDQSSLASVAVPQPRAVDLILAPIHQAVAAEAAIAAENDPHLRPPLTNLFHNPGDLPRSRGSVRSSPVTSRLPTSVANIGSVRS